jgi:hypothetical protein
MFHKTFEGRLEFKAEDRGEALIGEISDDCEPGLFVRIQSYDARGGVRGASTPEDPAHCDARRLAGKLVRVTIEELPEPKHPEEDRPWLPLGEGDKIPAPHFGQPSDGFDGEERRALMLVWVAGHWGVCPLIDANPRWAHLAPAAARLVERGVLYRITNDPELGDPPQPYGFHGYAIRAGDGSGGRTPWEAWAEKLVEDAVGKDWGAVL